jgi:hypothetical protein
MTLIYSALNGLCGALDATNSNCTFREIVALLSNADGVNNPITVQLVVVIFELRKLKYFIDMWTHKDRSMKQWDEFQNQGIWHVSIS